MKPASALSALAVAALGLALAPAGEADPLTVVDVDAPAYQFVFSPSGSVVVQDTLDTFAISGAAGLARLQSRTTQGLPGAAAAGMYRYSYRLDLTNVYGIVDIPCITSLKIKFGAVVSTLDYNGDSVAGDQVYVVTSGGLGSVGLVSAVQNGSYVTFNFASGGVCAGGSPGNGESSFFFGLVSTRAPKFVTATVSDNFSTTYTPQARGPKALLIFSGDLWAGVLQNLAQPSSARMVGLSMDMVGERRFDGMLLVGGESNKELARIPVQGTLSPSGHLQIVGRGVGARFEAAATEEGDNGLFVGRYRLMLGDGLAEEGMLTLAQDARLLPMVTIER